MRSIQAFEAFIATLKDSKSDVSGTRSALKLIAARLPAKYEKLTTDQMDAAFRDKYVAPRRADDIAKGTLNGYKSRLKATLAMFEKSLTAPVVPVGKLKIVKPKITAKGTKQRSNKDFKYSVTIAEVKKIFKDELDVFLKYRRGASVDWSSPQSSFSESSKRVLLNAVQMFASGAVDLAPDDQKAAVKDGLNLSVLMNSDALNHAKTGILRRGSEKAFTMNLGAVLPLFNSEDGFFPQAFSILKSNKALLKSYVGDMKKEAWIEHCRKTKNFLKTTKNKVEQSIPTDSKSHLDALKPILDLPSPWAGLMAMINKMYAAIDQTKPTSKDYLLAQMLAIFAVMMAKPCRIDNMLNIGMTEHGKTGYIMLKADGFFHLFVPGEVVKNKRTLKRKIPKELAHFILPWINIRDKYSHVRHSRTSTVKPGSFFEVTSRPVTVKNMVLFSNTYGGCRINPHGWRHIITTDCHRSGAKMEVAAELLSDDIATVVKVYLSLDSEKALEEYDRKKYA